MYICNICEKQFQIGTVNNMTAFIKHICNCPLQMKSIFRDRFCCKICEPAITFKFKRSFKDHLMAKHPPSDVNDSNKIQTPCSSHSLSFRKKRRIGMYSYQFIFYVYKGKCKIQSENIFFLAADELREIQIHTNTEQDNENEEFVPIQLEKNQAVFSPLLIFQ